jgi:hypothetical protein
MVTGHTPEHKYASAIRSNERDVLGNSHKKLCKYIAALKYLSTSILGILFLKY